MLSTVCAFGKPSGLSVSLDIFSFDRKLGYFHAISLLEESCSSLGRSKWQLPIYFNSKKTLTMTLPKDRTGLAEVEIEDQHYQVAFPNWELQKVVGQLCYEWKEKLNNRYLLNDTAVTEGVLQLLTQVAPYCRFVIDPKKGYVCELEKGLGADYKVLSQLKSRLTKLRRIPYVLSRKIILTQQLLRGLGSKNLESKHRFCSILRLTQSSEMPLIFANPYWQKHYCDEKDAARVSLAGQLGAFYSTKELAFDKYLLTRLSRLGTLQLSLTNVHFRDFLVRVQPDQDLLKELSSLVSMGRQEEQAVGSCWHPLIKQYGQEGLSGLFSVSHFPDRISCRSKGKASNVKFPSHFASLASETQFVISNKRSKLLRLPLGGYRVEVYGIDKRLADRKVQQGNLIFKSTFRWQGRNRARHVILKAPEVKPPSTSS